MRRYFVIIVIIIANVSLINAENNPHNDSLVQDSSQSVSSRQMVDGATDVRFDPEPSWDTNYDENGRDVNLRCKVRNFPVGSMKIYWMRNGQEMEDPRVKLLDNNQTLHIYDPVPDQSGYYNCSLWFSGAMIDSFQEYVTVQEIPETSHPRITKWNPINMTRFSNLGSSALLSCNFDAGSADSLITLGTEWQWANGSIIPDSDKYTWNETETGSVRELTLTINNVTAKDLTQYVCYGENAYGNASKVFTLQKQRPGSSRNSEFSIPLLICLSAGGVFILLVTMATIGVCLRRNRKEDIGWEKPDLEKFDVPEYEIHYDAFVSYSSEDEDWVKGHLFEQLEGQGYRVNIDFKDFVPGMAIAENIMDSIYKSRKTIVVMSKNFLKSMWGQFELQQVHNRAITQRKDVLILIKYSKCKVPGKLMGKTFLDWTDEGVKPHFWTRLYDAIGEPGNYKEIDEKDEEENLVQENYKQEQKFDLEKKDENAMGQGHDDIVTGQGHQEENKVRQYVRMTSDYSSGTSDFGESEEVFANVPYRKGSNEHRHHDNSSSNDSGQGYRCRISTECDSRTSCTSETQGLLA